MRKLITFFETRKRLTFFLAILWTIVIFIGCSMPGRELPKLGLFDNIDKVIHFLFFAVFFGIWYLFSNKSINSVLLIFTFAVLYGFGLEYYQLYCVAGRSFDVWDGAADGLGALSGWAVMRYFNSRKWLFLSHHSYPTLRRLRLRKPYVLHRLWLLINSINSILTGSQIA